VVPLTIYEVKPADTLDSISKKSGITAEKIKADNDLPSDSLVNGQALVLLPGEKIVAVRRGDSLYTIARKNRTTMSKLQSANPQIHPPYRLRPGMHLVIPQQEENKKSIFVNGYVFPQKDTDQLQSTMPYLTYLSIFSYHARDNGDLIPHSDLELIELARTNKTAPMMVVTNMDGDGGFNSSLAHTLLTNKDVQENYIKNILQTLHAKNYFGLDIDFEYVYPGDRESYNSFLSRMAETLSPKKITLTTALAPKTSGEQQGLLYTAHDYAHHGNQADHVILMTYEWGYTKGPAMAVSPLPEVKKVLKYATSVIPPNKILLGIPNYGYDWKLPFVRGTAARSISNTQAVEIAAKVGASIQYDEEAQAPYFHYTDVDKIRHEVWFSDARSIRASLQLVNQFGLAGISYWTIGRSFPQNWLVLRSMYNIKKLL
jgi:spore germination protein